MFANCLPVERIFSLLDVISLCHSLVNEELTSEHIDRHHINGLGLLLNLRAHIELFS